MDSRFISSFPPSLPQEAVALACRHFGIAVTKARSLGSERDENFRLEAAGGESYLLKITHPGEDPAVTNFQTACLAHVAAAEPTLPVPRVLPGLDGRAEQRINLTGLERTARLLTFLPGISLGHAERDPAQRARIGTTLARLDRALGSFSGILPALDLIWDMTQAAKSRHLVGHLSDPAARDLVGRHFDGFAARVLPRSAGLPRQPIHNDFNPHNLLVDPANHQRITGIIDFGDLAVAPRVYDLAVAASYQVLEGSHPLETAADVVAAYHAEMPLSDLEIALLGDLIAMRLALAVTITSWRAEAHPENRDYILRNSPGAWRALHQLSRIQPAEAEAYFQAATRGA